MKMAFVVHNEYLADRFLGLLREAGIDYFSRWDKVIGKGHGTDPHLGRGGFPSTNAVVMIAFQDEAALERLVGKISEANSKISRPDDHIRLFQMPLERIV